MENKTKKEKIKNFLDNIEIKPLSLEEINNARLKAYPSLFEKENSKTQEKGN